MITKETFEKCRQTLADLTLLTKHEEGDYVELVNEDDEQGPVQFCRKGGQPFLLMPRSVYDMIRKT
jgi:hypothetical protein